MKDSSRIGSGNKLVASVLIGVIVAILAGYIVLSKSIDDLKRNQTRYTMNSMGIVLDTHTGRTRFFNQPEDPHSTPFDWGQTP